VIIIDCAQGSAEWLEVRCGRLTASRIADVMGRIKSGAYSAARQAYFYELLAERLTHRPAPHYVSAAMQWGTDHEDEARRTYALMQEDVDAVEEVGFVLHDEIPHFGASPDGFVVRDNGDVIGLAEIKCPETKTHLASLLDEVIDPAYLLQMQAQMATTGFPWCDFVSFDPRLPVPMQLFVKRVPRDEEVIREIEREAKIFLAELDARVADLARRFNLDEDQA
jgi:putative phage-type endonuclease